MGKVVRLAPELTPEELRELKEMHRRNMEAMAQELGISYAWARRRYGADAWAELMRKAKVVQQGGKALRRELAREARPSS